MTYESRWNLLFEGRGGKVYGLDEPDDWPPGSQLSTSAKTQVRAVLRALAEQGLIRDVTKFRVIKDGKDPRVWEAKTRDGQRFFVIQAPDNHWYLTHWCKKPKERMLPTEAARARTIYGRTE